jgi:uncharacterized protein (TIGR04222 family)
MMSPLDMHGPQFLVFYLVVGVLTLLFIQMRFKQQEGRWDIPQLNLTDPYEIALLRGGENEALRIAALSLIDRGLLDVSLRTLKTKNNTSLDHARRPIEKAILIKFTSATEAYEMYNDDSLKSACADYRTSLEQCKLIANDAVFAARRPMLFLGILILGGLAAAKLFVALQRGRHNVIFLIIFAAIFLAYLFKSYNKERTGLGDRVLADLRSLFQGLKDRGSLIKAGGETNEAALLAAIFGVSALSAATFPYLEKLFPRAKNTNSCGTYYGCGSSCGSSCGGSCGGGGCGGCGGH